MNFSSFFNYPGQDDHDAQDLHFLHDRSEEEWTRLLAFMQVRRFRAGEAVLRQGDADSTLYLVARGSLEVLVPHGGKEKQIDTIEEGSIVGEQAFLDGRPRSATIRALTDGDLRLLTRDAFDILSVREPELARAVLFDLGRILSIRLRQATSVISRLL